MKTTGHTSKTGFDRRGFIQTGFRLAAVTGISGLSFLSACKEEEDGEGQEVSPPEDLMQEHGVLNRILLVYDTCRTHLLNKTDFSKEALYSSADIIRTFVEDYHEKQEEDYLFPRFRKANVLVDLVEVLLQQHKAGRTITDQVMQLSKLANPSENETQQLIALLASFNTMYRPHEAREDTVLFPAFRKIVSKHEYDSLGETFEDNEQKRFGKEGFETIVEKVAGIERSLGIYDIAQFTPKA